MEISIEQPCPTCGAVIVLKEDDRLVKCEFCDVHNYRTFQKLPRYALPARIPGNIPSEAIFYLPYLRFKGAILYCDRRGVHHKLIDTTRSGSGLDGLPLSLGLRPQAMHVSPVTENCTGIFVRQATKVEHILVEAARLTTLYSNKKPEVIYHRAFIGESISRVYLPMYRKGENLFDGVTNTLIGPVSLVADVSEVQFSKDWEPRFISTLCPKCAADMKGVAGTLVMHCDNCESQWSEDGGRFVRIPFTIVASRESEARYVPFWQVRVEAEGVVLETLADLIRLTNQPVVIQSWHKERQLVFIVPAFKIKPDIFLNISKKLTLLQQTLDERVAEKMKYFYPVTLEHQEALQSLKSIIAASAVSRKRVVEALPSLSFSGCEPMLVYLPFRDAGHDFIEHNSGVSIPAAALRHGLCL